MRDGGGPVFTAAELRTDVVQLKNFTRAQCDLTTKSATLAAAPAYSGGGGGGAGVRVVHSDPRALDAVLAASEARHEAAMAAMAARQEAAMVTGDFITSRLAQS